MSNERESWHLDRKVPIALIFTSLIQTSIAVWWSASTNSAVQVGENERVGLSRRLTHFEDERIDL